MDNQYFTGHGAQLDKRLSESGMMVVAKWYEADVAAQQGLSKQVFEHEYCVVGRHCEKWLKPLTREFGKHSERPAVERARAYLMRVRALLAVLACIRTGVRLAGSPDDWSGVAACRSLWAELSVLNMSQLMW